MEERAVGRGTVDPPSVVLVDDHTMFRQGLRQALTEHGFAVLGEAPNGRAGMQLALELRPEVVVMDVHMPQMDGIEATRALIAAEPAAKVLVLSIAEDEEEVVEALLAGASGYVLKSSRPEEVVRAILATRDGDSTLSPEVASRLVERLRTVSAASGDSTPASLERLTAREREILSLIAQGKENHEIAETLFISLSTAKNHVAHVLDKLGMENRVQAAVYAVRAGIV